MKSSNSEIPDVKIFTPEVFSDSRGFLYESFRSSWIPNYQFLQDNHSKSSLGTLRGLHYQLKNPQGKLLRVIRGEVFDVAVDLRKSSKTFGNWVGRFLSEENKEIFWVPPGFAHGFLVTSKTAELIYRCTNYYDPEDEHTIVWNDPDLNIEWPIKFGHPLISKKDTQGISFSEAPFFE